MNKQQEGIVDNTPNQKFRFDYIDQFRGFVGILMLVGHCSYYLNSIWLNLDPFDPLFPNWSQFALRYVGYLCAPGFLMMNGAMVWWSYHRRVLKGTPDWTVRWHLIQRGLFLIIVQMIWVNSSWGGFRVLQPWHFGIIASIGFSMILLTLIINLKWEFQLLIVLAILVIHPFLLNISYDPDSLGFSYQDAWFNQELVFEVIEGSAVIGKPIWIRFTSITADPDTWGNSCWWDDISLTIAYSID